MAGLIVKLPWEFLYYPDDNTFLGTDPRVALSCSYENWLNNEINGYATTDLPLRVLFVHAHPNDLKDVGFTDFMPEKLAELGQNVQINELKNPMPDEILQALKQKPHVFHFLGHGKPGFLALRDTQDGKALWFADQSLSDQLREGDVKLTVLQSCQGGTQTNDAPFAGTAAQLVQRHIPAVVAIRYPILQPLAWNFFKTFYGRLAHGDPVDVAVQAGREMLSVLGETHSSRDFGGPVLWTRLKAGQLFPATELLEKDISPQEKASSEAQNILSPKEYEVLKSFLEALVRDTRSLDPGGIKQTYKKATQEMPLNEIYVGLQADRDKPDVDRRVMQEELDEIRERLEKIEDAGEREKQYQKCLWQPH